LFITVEKNGTLIAAAEIATLIDHTLLKPEATEQDIARVCHEAREHSFATVCVNPYWVRFTAAELQNSDTKVCATIGFPLGANTTEIKVAEAAVAMEDGASEIDMVVNIGTLVSGNSQQAEEEIGNLAELAHESGALLKVILETYLLDDAQKKLGCEIAVRAGADFVKTSTGFSKGGATTADVRLMRQTVGDRAGVKASGGIRTLAALRDMVAAGANRIGTSSGVQILAELSHA
jgi:deoxyribose-phosphate aldolase